MRIKLIKSSFYKEALTKRALTAFIMGAEQLSIGEQCAKFELAFSRWQGRKYTVMFNSGSSANLALIQALMNLGRLKPKAKVAFSGITWATNVTPLIQLGLRPVAIDVDPHTLNISPQRLREGYQKEKFSCLFITNLLGYSDDLQAIRSFCKKNGILLIEDNCESLGSEFKGTKLGNFGVASTFSFFVGHHMSTIEGGAVCTDDPELHMTLRMVRSHGWDRHLTPDQRKGLHTAFNIEAFYSKYTFYDLGYNFRPTEIQGFLGLQQLKYLNGTIKKRAKNYAVLEQIHKNPDFHIIKNKMSFLSNFAFPIIVKTLELKNHYIQKAEREGIEIRPIVGGDMTAQPFYQKHASRLAKLPASRQIHDLGFYCGNNPEMTAQELAYVVKVFSKR